MKTLRHKLGKVVSCFLINNRIPNHLLKSPCMRPMLITARARSLCRNEYGQRRGDVDT